MTTNLFVIANIKQLRTGGCFRILLPFFQTSWGDGILNSAIFNSLHSRVEFGMIFEGLRNFGGGIEQTLLALKITMDPHIPVHVNIEYLDDRYPKLKICIPKTILHGY